MGELALNVLYGHSSFCVSHSLQLHAIFIDTVWQRRRAAVAGGRRAAVIAVSATAPNNVYSEVQKAMRCVARSASV